MSEIIAFIGVGNMGNPMAQNLVKAGKKVKVFDVSKNMIEKAKTLKQRLRFFTLIMVFSYIVLGPEWLTSEIASEQSLIRIGIVSVLILYMITILNSVTEVFTSEGQYGILKFLGYSALGISFLAELSGFHNLSTFVLTGFMITLMSGYILWSLLELNESSIEWINNSTSVAGVKILDLLGYESITDRQLHNNPNVLDEYDSVIVLHNEYVSKTMFDAITSHDNVIFLYPNALYAQVNVDTTNNLITLVRGHNYPSADIINGFDWKNENTHPYEYDTECENWEFYPTKGTPNGYMLNCYPENIIWKDELFLQTLKDLVS